MSALHEHCPLCARYECREFHHDRVRSYLQCQNCKLIFVPKSQHLSASAEKKHYDLHQNSPDDVNYRKFLAQLADPLLGLLRETSYGLDFGCGPGPTLSVMLEEHGHRMDVYDSNYFKNEWVWQNQYDFVTATEVIEHLREPRTCLERISTCLKANGLLAIMTLLTDNVRDFGNWHYMRDPTHICFYSLETFKVIANNFSLQIIYADRNVVIFRHL